MKKRLISLLLAFSMMLTFLPAGAVSAFAEEESHTYDCGETPKTVTATLSRNNDGDETYTLTITGDGPMANYDGYKTSSNNSCAPWCEKIQNITRLIVEDGVTTLGDDILYYGYYDYSNDESHSFYSDLREVELPEGLSYIGARAFCDSPKLNEVKIPSTVTKIKDGAFWGCTGLTKIELPPQLEEVGYSSFYGCSGLTEITIPSSVKIIRSGAFEKCYNLESVTLSEGIGEIGTEAFRSTNLKSLNIPKSVKKLGRDIVDGCQHLAYITIEAPSQLEETFEGNEGVFHPDGNTNVYCEPKLERLLRHFNEYVRFITTVDVTLVDGDTITPKKIDYGADITALDKDKPTKQGYTFTGWYTDPACKNKYPDTQLFTNINGTTLYAGWATSDLTVKNGTISVIDSDGNPLNIELENGKAKVPAGATVTVTFDRAAAAATADDNLKFAGWKITGLNDREKPGDTSQEVITFTVPADCDAIEVEAVCEADKYQLFVTGGTAAVEKDGHSLNIVPVENGDKKTYSVPNGAKVTVTLDKTQIPEGMVFDIWTTGNFSLPSDQNSKAETITFTMSESVDIAAQYRDAATDHTHDTAVCHPLTLKDGVITSVTVPGKDGADPEDITEIVKKNANEDGSFHVPEGATVSVAFDKDAFADSGLKFGHWDITGLDDPNAYQDKESFAFEMPAKAVTLKAMTQDASIEDDEPDIVGPIVIGTTVVVGGAVLGYQAYSLGAEFAGKLMALPYFPSNRSALAMMLWEDAGKPMPESELLYPDVGQEERDMDLQHAARWAMENELIPDLNDEGTAPEEMKFYPDNAVSKIDVLNAWQKAQELKQNA